MRSLANVGTLDRSVRFVVAAGLLALAAFRYTGAGAAVCSVLGLIALMTAVFRFCPLYRLLGISTCPTPRPHP